MTCGPAPTARSGSRGPAGQPPFGTGSLGLQVSNNALSGGTPQEKVSFGNEVDFFGDQVANLTAVGYRVFQTSENVAISPSNLPNITLEIDPNVGTSNYTSWVWVPDPIPTAQQDRWSSFQSAAHQGQWYFTGAAGTITGCNQTTMCSFSAAKAALVANQNGDGPATIYTVAVAKGRDNAWVGAVDGLRNQQHEVRLRGIRSQRHARPGLGRGNCAARPVRAWPAAHEPPIDLHE